MNRLTIRNIDGSVSQPTHSTFEKVFNRLAEYEDMEEQGLLVRLPCKVGEPIYYIIDDCELSGCCGTKRMCKGCEYRNLFVEEDVFRLCLLTDKGVLRSEYYATREEAEKALEDA